LFREIEFNLPENSERSLGLALLDFVQKKSFADKNMQLRKIGARG
jgi:hypothetical protein